MYNLMRGVTDYAVKNDWHLGIITSRMELPRNWSGDGIITHINDNSPKLIEFLKAHADVPIVSFNSSGCNFPHAVVCDDNEEIGRVAARYFLTLGDMLYCWYGGHGGRRAGFVEELAKNHREVVAVTNTNNIHNQPWDKVCLEIVTQLKNLPLPCAIFCENDSYAREMIEAAVTGGFRVPEDIAILGVDNETLICNSSRIPISSIDSRVRKVGYEGAALLDRMMAGEPLPSAPLLVSPVPVPVIRKSTDILATGDEMVAKAIKYIKKNHTSDISVADIARTVHISDSGLRKLINRKIGTSPSRLLQDMRIGTACRLLRETELKIETISKQSGFNDVQRLHELFKYAMKTTPARFRYESRDN